MPYLHGAVLCDAARDYGGKVSILGGFVNIVTSPAFPIAAPVWFAGRVAFDANEAQQPHVIVVRARSDETAEVLGEVRGEFATLDPAQLPMPDMPGGVNLVFPLPFPIPTPGLYWVDLLVDDEPLTSLALNALAGPPAPPQVPGP